MTNEVLDIHKYTENGVRYVRMTEDHFNQFIADTIATITTKLMRRPLNYMFNGLAVRPDGTVGTHDIITGETKEYPNAEAAYISLVETLARQLIETRRSLDNLTNQS